jgi:hypothetical protein
LDKVGLHGVYPRWPPVAKYKLATGTDPGDGLESRLAPIWQEERDVRWPVFIKVGRVDQAA